MAGHPGGMFNVEHRMFNDSPPERHDKLDHVVDGPGQPGVGAKLLAEPDQDQGVDEGRPVQAWHGTPASSWAGNAATGQSTGRMIHWYCEPSGCRDGGSTD